MIFHSKCQGNIAIYAQGVCMGVEDGHTVKDHMVHMELNTKAPFCSLFQHWELVIMGWLMMDHGQNTSTYVF